MDDALRAESAPVADRAPLLDEYVRADLAAAPENRAFDHGAAAHVRRRIDHRAGSARLLAQGDARPEHGVRTDRRPGRDPRVVADEGRRFDLIEIVELDAV